MDTRPLLLIVDDEPAILHTLKQALEDEQYTVETLANGQQTLEKVGALVPDLVLLDIFMPKCNGLELLVNIRREYPAQKVMMISGYGTVAIATEAIKKGATDFIEKPLNLDEILDKIAYLKNPNKTKELPKANDAVPYDFQRLGIVGASSMFAELMQNISLLAPLNLPVLLYGPRGSGKTLVARYLHAKSTQAKGLFNIVDCATKPSAQTLAAALANSGTLVLKHIDTLSQEGQALVYQAMTTHTLPCRIVATSTPDLFKRVHSGMFNASLFGILQAAPIEIPSLNKRRYDIPLLVSHFMNESNKLHTKSLTATTAAIRLLRNHYWIGDVAELESFIEILVTTTPNRNTTIDAADVCRLLPENNIAFVEEQLYTRFASLDHATQTFQKRYLKHLLTTHRYDTQHLASFLKIPITQLHDTMVKLEITLDDNAEG
jgi:DNA-binding NtrC family response regulator